MKESLKTSTPKRSSYRFREVTVLNKTSKRLPRVEFVSQKPCTSKQAKPAGENENECCVCASSLIFLLCLNYYLPFFSLNAKCSFNPGVVSI